jgi:GAF domain-containing protein
MRRSDYIAEASRQLLTNGFSARSVNAALRILGRGADVDRVYVFEDGRDPVTHERVTSQRFEWVATGIEPQIDDPACQDMPYDFFGEPRAAALLRGEVVSIVTRTMEHGDLREILEAQGIRALLLCPIVHSGEVWGFVGFDDCRNERVWPLSEIASLEAIARALAAALRSDATKATLTSARQQLKAIL